MVEVEETQAQRRQRIESILGDMQVKLNEINTLRDKLLKEQSGGITVQQSTAMLEEIEVPSLEAIKDDKKKK